MSPARVEVAEHRSTISVSPGKIVGSMLHPVTWRVSLPEVCKTSVASSQRKECDSLGTGEEGFMKVGSGLRKLELTSRLDG